MVGVLAAGVPAVAHAQGNAAASDELTLLQEAGALETAGDLEGSERVLRSILTMTPTSLSALISLERILAMQGKTADLIPAVDRLLASDAESPIGHQMRVRALSALDRVEELEMAAGEWIAATPKIETPYREIARVWRQRHELRQAVKVLELGRSRIRRADALALELGDVFAEAGDYRSAVREWNRAIGGDGHGFLLVQRRTMNLPDGGAAVIPQLVDALAKPPTTMPRQKAAAQLAIDAGLDVEAEAITRSMAGALKGAQRQSLLVEVARRSDGAGLDQLAYWAYRELVMAGGSVDQMLAVRTRLAELALAVGDTVSAAAAYRELERAYAVGSPQRRQAIAVRIELLARDGQADRARAELDAFRGEFADAPELDGVAAAVANALIDQGDELGAQTVLTGVSGPRSGLALSRILIARGEVERARNELLISAPALHGAEATQAIALAALLGRLSKEGGELVAKAMTNAAAGEREDAVDLLFDESKPLSGTERATILDFAAQLADRANLGEQAEQIRREIITEYPRCREAPGAMLSIARTLAVQKRAPEEARLLLENLILEHPRSALVPQARRELDQLLGRVPARGVSSPPSSHSPQR
jgi:hypothetical protein